jgi:hypothetical protein
LCCFTRCTNETIWPFRQATCIAEDKGCLGLGCSGSAPLSIASLMKQVCKDRQSCECDQCGSKDGSVHSAFIIFIGLRHPPPELRFCMHQSTISSVENRCSNFQVRPIPVHDSCLVLHTQKKDHGFSLAHLKCRPEFVLLWACLYGRNDLSFRAEQGSLAGRSFVWREHTLWIRETLRLTISAALLPGTWPAFLLAHQLHIRDSRSGSGLRSRKSIARFST